VLWQHVFQVVLCLLSAVQCAPQSVHTSQTETHSVTTLQNL